MRRRTGCGLSLCLDRASPFEAWLGRGSAPHRGNLIRRGHVAQGPWVGSARASSVLWTAQPMISSKSRGQTSPQMHKATIAILAALCDTCRPSRCIGCSSRGEAPFACRVQPSFTTIRSEVLSVALRCGAQRRGPEARMDVADCPYVAQAGRALWAGVDISALATRPSAPTPLLGVRESTGLVSMPVTGAIGNDPNRKAIRPSIWSRPLSRGRGHESGLCGLYEAQARRDHRQSDRAASLVSTSRAPGVVPRRCASESLGPLPHRGHDDATTQWGSFSPSEASSFERPPSVLPGPGPNPI